MKPVTAMPAPPHKANRINESTNELQEQIRQRAQELYQQRGRVDGFALEDWLRAEAEILRARKQPIAKKAKASK